MCSWSRPAPAGPRRRARQAALLAFAVLPAACSDLGPGDGELADLPEGEAASAAQELALPFPIDERKSLLVTDVDIVSEFKLKDVFQQLIDQSGAPGLTPLALFQRFIDTNRSDATGIFADVPHCDEVLGNTDDIYPPFDPGSVGGPVPIEQQVQTGSRNGWPIFCPRPIGIDATRDPFTDLTAGHAYTATTLANRFDLAPPDGADCGEYRIVFARRSGAFSGVQRHFIIFEARLPNPNPSLGRQACRPVVEFWQNLSDPAKSPATRASELKAFYFDGLPGFEPVIHIDHYGNAPGPNHGHVRTNEFTFFPSASQAANTTWSLREFRVTHGTSSAPSLSIVPSFVDDNPAAKLFSPAASSDPRVSSFQGIVFPSLVNRLAAADDINRFAYGSSLPDELNAGESLATPFNNNYLNAFDSGGSLKSTIQSSLTSMGSDLTPEQVVARAQSLSCAGCHEPLDRDGSTPTFDVGVPGTPFPDTLGFTHTSEKTESIDGTTRQRFIISGALTGVFLPFRKRVMEEFLLGDPILGFEKPNAWTASRSVQWQHTGRVKEGVASLEFRPLAAGATLTSASFSTAGFTPVGDKIKIELFVPTIQANPSAVGTVEVRLSIPSAGISNLSAGSVDLTSLPRGTFSTVVFPALPASAVSALNAAPSDVQLKFVFNVAINSTTINAGPYYLDNVRFEN
ncbi:hypothetical protein [Sorangium cellulosum]|uniref:hypothetical protein n=1 Tax=Sorangium cellulosum TaxID=56 RepID=UPI001F29ED88|nr:hypothetical protein [Sorangium cellulosum]